VDLNLDLLELDRSNVLFSD